VHNFNAVPYPMPSQTVHALFAAQAVKTPSAVAARYGAEQIRYGELNRRANQLAHYLCAQGLQPGALVGLCVERSIAMLVGMIGILKAGGAYLPLDPSFPHERLAQMLADGQAHILLTHATLNLRFDQARSVALDTHWNTIAAYPDHAPDSGSTAHSLAYVMYTSGSTGKPKGVMVPHAAIVRLVRETNYVQLTPQDCIAQAANHSFDAATFEIWGALLNGARLEGVRKQDLLSPQIFYRLLRERGISTLFLTTALFNQLVSECPDIFAPLNYLLFGGEAVHPARVRQVLEHGRPAHFQHVYGPTENTTFSTWYEITDVAENAVTVPIGGPLAGTSCYILDAHQRPVPVGVPGELYVGGVGLAQGYWQCPELTAEKFVPNPFDAGRLYRTGDMARWRADGAIEFIGRVDHQIKLRGFRIELGEIEAALEQHPAIAKAVVVLQQNHLGDNRLVGFLHLRTHAKPDAREYLREILPDYMVPAVFIVVERMPLNSNGKIDRHALARLEINETDAATNAGHQYAPPRDALESVLADIWAETLNLPHIGIYDSFFKCGGDSLKGMELLNKCQKRFHQSWPITALFECPTVADFAGYVQHAFPNLASEFIQQNQSKRDYGEL